MGVVRSRPRNICNNFRVRGPRYYYQGDTFNCPVQGFVSFVTVASLNQRKLIVVSEYCLAPVTVAVGVSPLRPFSPTHYSHVFLTPSKHFFSPTPHATTTSSHCFIIRTHPPLFAPFIAHPIRVILQFTVQ